MQEYNDELELGNAEIEAGNYISHEDVKKIDELLLRPERNQPDKFKMNNGGSYKAFEVYNYRVPFRLFLIKYESFV